MIPDPAPPFEVHASGLVRDRIRRMLERSRQLGVGDEIARSITAILEHLMLGPREWGDPLRHFRSLQMTQFGRMIAGFRCEYSVHDRIPMVVISKLFPVPNNPLCGQGFDP